MDQRSHYPQHSDPFASPDADGSPLGQQAAWPRYDAPQPGPIQGHAAHHAPMSAPAPHHGQDYAQPFAQSQPGFVMPGAQVAQQAMGADGGVIGAPTMGGGAHAFDQHAQQPQAWAYPTPDGMQLVQANGQQVPAAPQHPQYGYAPHGQVGVPQHAQYAAPQHPQYAAPQQAQYAPPQHAAPHAQYAAPQYAAPYPAFGPDGMPLHAHHAQHVSGAAGEVPHLAAAPRPVPRTLRSRLRWETIVPVAAVASMLLAATWFIGDFDRMTGRGGDGSTAASATGGGEDAGLEALAPEDAMAADAAAGDVAAAADLAEQQRSLRAQVLRQRAAGRWSSVLTSIDQLAALGTLTPDVVAIQAQARTKLAIARRNKAFAAAYDRAMKLEGEGRTRQALAVVDAALKQGANARLSTLRATLAARLAAASRPPAGAPPSAGGQPPATTTSRPPAAVPNAVMPPRPDAPNPGGGAAAGGGATSVSGQPATTGGATTGATTPASTCHTHDGVTDCH